MDFIVNSLEIFLSHLSKLSPTSKKFIFYSAITSTASCIFYYIFLRKKKDNEPKTTFKSSDGRDISLTKNQIDFMKRKMRFEGLKFSRSLNKLDFKNKKNFKLNNPIKKFENQRTVLKGDQIFFNILNKFTSFVLRNKFAFAFA